MDVLPNPVREKDYTSWTQFYHSTNALFDGYEFCDCFRSEPFEADLTNEHRYYQNDKLGIKISYFQMFHLPFQFRFDPHHLKNYFNHTSHSWIESGVADVYTPSAWHCTLIDCFDQGYFSHLSQLPTTIVINFGIWKVKGGALAASYTNKEYLTSFVETVHKVLPYCEKIIWRTTSRSNSARLHKLESDEMACRIKGVTCMNVSFTKDVRAELFTDGLHFQVPIYNAWILQLRDIIKYGQMNNEKMEYSNDTLAHIYEVVNPTYMTFEQYKQTVN
eukprot:gene17744-24734_t